MISELYVVNLIYAAALPLIYILLQTKILKLPLINPITIVALFAFPIQMVILFSGPYYFLADGLLNTYYQYAVCVSNTYATLGILTFCLLIMLFRKSSRISKYLEKIWHASGGVKPARMQKAALIFWALYALSFLMLAQSSFGVANWILDPRSGYQFHRSGAGHWYALAANFLSVSAFLWAVYTPSPKRLLITFPIFLISFYVMGSKGKIIAFLVLFLIALWVSRFKYFKSFAAAVVVVGGILFLSLLSAGGITLDFRGVASYSDHYINAARYYDGYVNERVPLFGGEVYATQFYGAVPRAVWPDKPYVYGMSLVNEIFYPGLAAQGHTPAFATVDYFADYGWMGVFGFGLFNTTYILNAICCALLYKRRTTIRNLAQQRHGLVITYVFMFMYAPVFLIYLTTPINYVFFVLVVLSLVAVNRFKFGSSMRKNENSISMGVTTRDLAGRS